MKPGLGLPRTCFFNIVCDHSVVSRGVKTQHNVGECRSVEPGHL